MQHLEDHGFLTDLQHCFRAKHFCKTQLVTLVDELLQGVAKGKQYDLAIMDFSRAFLVVPHTHLLKKLQYYCVKAPCLDWINDVLKNRSQKIVVYSELSEEAAVTFRVPSGSVQGQILFLTFINNIPEHVNYKYQPFADDSIIYREVKSNGNCDQPQQDLDSLHEM